MEQKIDGITRSSIMIEATRVHEDKTEVGSAVMSGFLWKHKDESFVITNWHNVTGINPDTNEYIGSFTPNQFTITIKYHLPSETKGLNDVMGGKRKLNLYENDDKHIWLEHHKGKAVDVVAIPIDLKLPDKAIISYINDQDYELNWLPDVGDECFIIGHPEGFSGPLETPVWKRGSVATLPLLDYDNKPVFLVDTIGNKGLSGAAVIGRGKGIFDSNPGKRLSPDAIFGSWSNFIGVYAGRISKTGIGSQLGRVWKKSVIDEIFKHNT